MSTTVPSADAKAVVKAVEGLSAQVRRVADALSTPVVEYAVRADDDATTPDDDQTLRWARRESLLVLLTRLQRGRALTEAEAGTLRHHVETEIREADTARAVARSNLRHVKTIVPELEQAQAAIERVRSLVAGIAHPTSAGIRDYDIGRYEMAAAVVLALTETDQPTTKEN